MIADAPMGKELGNTFANLVAGEGAELAKWLLSSGIVQESGPEKSWRGKIAVLFQSPLRGAGRSSTRSLLATISTKS